MNHSLLPGQLSVVLVEPSHPGNVGAAARAMHNMGVTDLRLVNPCDHLGRPARTMAPNSAMILEQATLFPSLQAAVQDCHLVVGTSARERYKMRDALGLADLSSLLAQFPPGISIAIVFGRESSGLTNEEMCLCNEWLRIPTYGENSSLNLAQAVMVVLYEFSRHYSSSLSPQKNRHEIATAESLQGLKEHLFRIFGLIDFFEHRNPETLWKGFSGLLGRARPDSRDIRILRGFLNKIEVALGAKKRRKERIIDPE